MRLVYAALALLAAFLAVVTVMRAPAAAQVASEAFSLARAPSPGPAEAIGAYARGCLAGGAILAPEGRHWQTMRPSRRRAFGHPDAIAFVEALAAKAPTLGMAGILVGDISQPRGGPMPYGHTSHQVGLDVDIWLTEMPADRLSLHERETAPMVSVLSEEGTADPTRLTPAFHGLIRAAAEDPRTARIFVNPLIKRALCEAAGEERGWLRRVRAWYGHDAHFHVRLQCPAGSPACVAQTPPPPGDGCGAALAYWFTAEPYRPRDGATKGEPLRLADLPPACRALSARAPAHAHAHAHAHAPVPRRAPRPVADVTTGGGR